VLVIEVVIWLRVQLSMLDQQQAQLFNRREQVVADLFLEYFAEQAAEGAHIAAQRSFLQIAIVTGELR
jgi:hypothetical protein